MVTAGLYCIMHYMIYKSKGSSPVVISSVWSCCLCLCFTTPLPSPCMFMYLYARMWMTGASSSACRVRACVCVPARVPVRILVAGDLTVATWGRRGRRVDSLTLNPAPMPAARRNRASTVVCTCLCTYLACTGLFIGISLGLPKDPYTPGQFE